MHYFILTEFIYILTIPRYLLILKLFSINWWYWEQKIIYNQLTYSDYIYITIILNITWLLADNNNIAHSLMVHIYEAESEGTIQTDYNKRNQ